MWELLGAIGGIILVDLTLSGDNALVIGAVAARLPVKQQRWAIMLGGSGAIALRIALGAAATLLLHLPLLQALGGALLLIVAVRLLAAQVRAAHDAQPEGSAGSDGMARGERGFLAALVTILLADVTMSLDNVLAVGALAAGNLPVLAGGLLLSMLILLVGSALVARLIARAAWLVDAAAAILGWTSGQMVAHDAWLQPYLARLPGRAVVLPLAGVALVLAGDVALRLIAIRRHRSATTLPAPDALQKMGVPAPVAPRAPPRCG